MGITWRLKSYLARKHAIYGATELQKIIKSRTGVVISLPVLGKYLKGRPKMIPLATMEVLCTALNCNLSRFCTVTSTETKWSKVRKLSYKNTPLQKRGGADFPDPRDYE